MGRGQRSLGSRSRMRFHICPLRKGRWTNINVKLHFFCELCFRLSQNLGKMTLLLFVFSHFRYLPPVESGPLQQTFQMIEKKKQPFFPFSILAMQFVTAEIRGKVSSWNLLARWVNYKKKKSGLLPNSPSVAHWCKNGTYRKFSNKGTSPNKGTPLFFLTPSGSIFTFLPISQLIIVLFLFRKKPLEGGNVLYTLETPPKGLSQHPVR